MERVRLGLVGVGIPSGEPHWKARLHYHVPSIAWARYFPQIAGNPKAELVAVCDVVESCARLAQEKYKARQVFLDYEEMLKKADIDAVIITTPSNLHASMTIKAVRAGKHVLVEKPLATNMEDAEKVLEETNRARVKTLTLPWIYSRFFMKVRELIDAGEIGKVAVARGRFSHGGSGHSEWFYRADKGGSVIFDMGIYAVSHITGWLGSARKVHALSSTVLKKRMIRDKEIDVDIEDNAIIGLDLGGDRLATIETNYCTVSAVGPIYELHGTDGSIFLEGRDTDLRVYSQRRVLNDLSGWMVFRDFEREQLSWGVADPVVNYFIDSILKDKDTTPLIQHQVHVIEILEKSRLSSEMGKALDLTTTFKLPPTPPI